MIKVESQWLCFNSVLFSLALMGICCKNSSWCNGTAYAKISHKPLQLHSEVFHLVWACLRCFFVLLCILCALHTTTVNLSLTLFCHPAHVALFQTWTFPVIFGQVFFFFFKWKDFFNGIKAIQFFSLEMAKCISLPRLDKFTPQHLPLILISCLINKSVWDYAASWLLKNDAHWLAPYLSKTEMAGSVSPLIMKN